MKFFVDTANLDQIKEAADLGILDGCTTNPTLMAKEGITGEKNVWNHYKKICEIVDGDVSAEVIATDYKGMVDEGKKLAKLHKNIVVKERDQKLSFPALFFSTIEKYSESHFRHHNILRYRKEHSSTL